MIQGRFITFEGGEGSGKSTQIKLLEKSLKEHDIKCVLTREPGGSPMAERIRDLLLDPDARLDAMTQLMLFSAARRDHVFGLIAPELAKGKWVLCDRFADSSRAYQGAAGLVSTDTILRYETDAIGSTRPDLTIILDIPPRVGLERARKRRAKGSSADSFEAADLTFHDKVRNGFLDIAKAEPERCAVLDAEQPKEKLQRDILQLCMNRLPHPEQAVVHG